MHKPYSEKRFEVRKTAYYIIPSKKELKKNPSFSRTTWDEVYKDFICDICDQHLKEHDAYVVVRTDEQVKNDGKSGYRHVKCDPDYSH